MARAEFVLELKTATLWTADRLMQGLRVTSPNVPKFGEVWLWLDRETDQIGELKPHIVGALDDDRRA